jgi:heat-inducible transcriptional repressor
MDQAELPESIQNTILHQFYQAAPGTDQWMHLAASVLAHQSHVASMITAPRADVPKFQHLELISTQGRQILMVLVLAGGGVSQQLLTLAEPVAQERLSQTAARLNGLFSGQSTVATLPAQDARTARLVLVLGERRAGSPLRSSTPTA